MLKQTRVKSNHRYTKDGNREKQRELHVGVAVQEEEAMSRVNPRGQTSVHHLISKGNMPAGLEQR